MTAHTTIPVIAVSKLGRPEQNPVVKAWADRYRRDPKLANEIVTGACCWDYGTRADDIQDLAGQAADKAHDYAEAFCMGQHVPGGWHTVEQLQAAEIALCDLAHDAKEREREEQDRLDSLPYMRRHA